jgi:hypothetical protein
VSQNRCGRVTAARGVQVGENTVSPVEILRSQQLQSSMPSSAAEVLQQQRRVQAVPSRTSDQNTRRLRNRITFLSVPAVFASSPAAMAFAMQRASRARFVGKFPVPNKTETLITFSLAHAIKSTNR